MWYKYRLSHILFYLFFCFSLLPNNSFAMTAQDAFRSGIESAKLGDYQAARKEFEHALQLGLNSAALRYNLAVSYYRLKLYTQAYDKFLTLVSHPNLGAVAAYNLGLTTEKQRRLSEAKRWYLQAKSTSHDTNLRKLSARALRYLDGQVIVNKPIRRSSLINQWRGKLSIQLSYDDNLERSRDGFEQIGKSSEFDLTGSGYLAGNRRNGWKLSGRLYGLNYLPRSYLDASGIGRETTDSNSSFAEIATAYYLKKFAWRYRIAAIASNTLLNGVVYQSARGFELRTEKHIIKLIKLRFRYRYRDIVADNFDFVAGNKKQFRMDVQVANGRNRRTGKKVRFTYIYEVNKRHDDNYSPQRTWFRFAIDSPVSVSAKLRIAIEQRTSTYDSFKISASTTAVRNDYRLRLRLELNYKLTSDWRYKAGVVYTVNDSDAIDSLGVSVHDYSQNVFYSSIAWYY